MSLWVTGRPITSAMMSATSLTVSDRGPVGAYCAPAWASGSTSVSTATAAMSAASTKASAPPRVGTVMAPSMTGTCSSLKFCITHAGRKIEEVGHQAGVLDPHDGRDEVDAVDAFQGTGMGSRVVPVEQHVGVVARGRTRIQAPVHEFLCHQRSGSSGTAEHKCRLL